MYSKIETYTHLHTDEDVCVRVGLCVRTHTYRIISEEISGEVCQQCGKCENVNHMTYTLTLGYLYLSNWLSVSQVRVRHPANVTRNMCVRNPGYLYAVSYTHLTLPTNREV